MKLGNWRAVPLGEVCDVGSGGTPSREKSSYFDGVVPWVKIGDMLQDPVVSTEERISVDGLAASSAKLFPAGTLLVSIFATIGRTAVLAIPAATNQAIAGITPRDHDLLSVPFLRRFLDYSVGGLRSQGRGVAQSNINLSILRRLPVPLPPIEEQRRIAAILDKADELRAKRRAALAHLDTLTQSIFLEMFGDPLTNVRGHRQAALGDVLRFKSGAGLTASQMVSEGPYPVFGGNGVAGFHDEFMFEDRKVVVGRVGAYCGCVHVTPERSWVSDNALYVTELDASLELDYLALAFSVANFNQYASQSGQPLVSGPRLYPVRILVPPISEQREFKRRARSVRSRADSLARAADVVGELFASLQQRAFSGML